MDALNCPITGEKILSITRRGVERMSNYAEVWFGLNDGSRMRVAVSRNAKKDIKKLKTDEIFGKIKTDMLQSVKGKSLDKKTSDKQTARINKLTYHKVFDKVKTYVNKKDVNN